ncbi:ATP-dependent RNA helicase-like protein 2 [Sarcoptes scabiei]|uniref:RNA helicase n=1 Tax=Sarcoptes scabiei TaxID=52283 RepID=A0A132AEU5_SARSC|nr:ATP-dependent RNA helicase-like protein 2 [Sarcoptes scabiei]
MFNRFSFQTFVSNKSLHSDLNLLNDENEDPVLKYRRDHQIFIKNVPETNEKNVFKFEELQLPDPLRRIVLELGFDQLTPIQSQALPILFAGQDLIGIAQTGSGKTLAFLLPAFDRLFSIHEEYLKPKNDRPLNPRVLILAPTRELAVQINDVIQKFQIFKSVCLYGGNDRKKQILFLEQNNPLFLVSTPGRLRDLIEYGCIDLSSIEYLVIDEADRMLDMGFEPQISYLIKKCPDLSRRQTMMFSASWPEEVQSLVTKYLKQDHAFVSVGGTELVANHNIDQQVIVCTPFERFSQLDEIFHAHSNDKILLFCNTKSTCDSISRMIRKKYRLNSSPLHGDMTQRQREFALDSFRRDQISIICATDVAARGLDITDINVVINFDFPLDIETYVHRIGRTGRQNKRGIAYSFYTNQESSVLARKLIKILEESSCKVPEELRTIEHNDHKSQPKRKRSFQQQHYWRQNRFNHHHHHHHHDYNNQYKNRQ